MKQFAVIHNVPTPYRVFLFNEIGKQIHDKGFELVVYFMAEAQSDRPQWKGCIEEATFRWKVYRKKGNRFRGKDWHCNLKLLLNVFCENPSILLVCGPWDSMTGIFCTFTKQNNLSIAWYESNTFSPGRIGPVFAAFKRTLLESHNFVAVPGIEGEQHCRSLLKVKKPTTVRLPNLIDDQAFVQKDQSLPRFNLPESDTLDAIQKCEERFILWPARLIPAKNIIRTIVSLKSCWLKGWKILLIGCGPGEARVKEAVERSSLGSHVIHFPVVNYRLMPFLYRRASLFMLTSVSDPNPLSVVEALHSGLPLIVSNRLGNIHEILEDGVNGWGVNPYSSIEIGNAVKTACSRSEDQLKALGSESLRIAKKHWNPVAEVTKFLCDIGV